MPNQAMRYVKYGVIALTLTGASIALIFFWPAQFHGVDYKLPGSDIQIGIELKPMNPIFAEYERRLVVKRAGVTQITQDIFPDTGGYLRTNVYQLKRNEFVVKGFFDEWIVRTSPLSVVLSTETIGEAAFMEREAGFLGAFDVAPDRNWRFIPKKERAEQTVVPKGG